MTAAAAATAAELVPTGVIPGTDFERNGYHDSDFYCYRWTGEEIRSHELGSTRYPPQPGNYFAAPLESHADADTLRAADVWAAEQIALARHDRDVIEWARLERGTRVKILRPCKNSRSKNACEPGATGTVGWIGERRSRYGTWSYGFTYGIDLDGETQEWRGRTRARRIFLADLDGRFEVIDPKPDNLARYRAEEAERLATAAPGDTARRWVAVHRSRVSAAMMRLI